MTAFYSTKPRSHKPRNPQRPPAPLASLFFVTSGKASAVERPSIDSPVVAKLERGDAVYGMWHEVRHLVGSVRWVRRINGGYVLGICVEEVV